MAEQAADQFENILCTYCVILSYSPMQHPGGGVCVGVGVGVGVCGVCVCGCVCVCGGGY